MSSLTKKLAVFALVLLGLGITSLLLPVVPMLRHVCTWVGNLGPIGVLIIALLLAAGSLVFLPASPFVIGASAVFGFPLGLAGSLVGVTLGAAFGFLLARWFLRKDLSEHLRKREVFRAIDLAIERDGWKIVILLRLCPIPFGLANYLYGLTSVHFRAYLVATILGSLPSLCLFSHLGSVGRAELEALSSGHLGQGQGQIALLAISGLATLAALILLPKFAKKAVEKYARVSVTSEI
ncbi:MAG: TVP38/TMEM64 family protein [Verrucomicrobia bacterium]|nr:TVP38/TMEM64 family protein [Verrucomicrobiota bacterium]MBV9671623.1 TVP38/TMEM64 family protein [Verrucomicrobiota bacterium]